MAKQDKVAEAAYPGPPTSKPLLRGWFHAVAAVVSVVLTAALVWRGRDDTAKWLSVLVFGLSMIELYTVSAIYHMGRWREKVWRTLRALDHSNIFLLIAGTYTPICVVVLNGLIGYLLLGAVWLLAGGGIFLAVISSGISKLRVTLPRWLGTILYMALGWVAFLALPAFAAVLPLEAIGVLLLGGLLYTIGGVIYARKRPNPFPRVFGFHEVFHLFVVGGGAAFAAFVWLWVLPFPNV